MDPASAFSLAGTILQFIDTGGRFIGLALSFYRSPDEASSTFAELGQLTGDFERILAALEAPSINTASLEHDANGLVQLAGDCRKVTKELHLLLEKFIPEKKGKKSKRDAIKLAFDSMWTKNEINFLSSKLEGFRSQINLHLLVSLRQHVKQTSAQQEDTLKVLGIVSQKSSELEGSTKAIVKFLAARASSSDVTAIEKSLRRDLVAEIYQGGSRGTRPGPPAVPLSLERRTQLQREVLSSLRFEDIDDRTNRIKEAHGVTLQWVLNEDRPDILNCHNVREWLESDNQIYWITGKPGSGKSTLMKYLCQPVHQQAQDLEETQEEAGPEARCLRYLKNWAGGDVLHLASFYFWNSGTDLQMTNAGMLRTLLYQILLDAPEIIPDILPSRWEALCILDFNPPEWTESEIRNAFDLMVDVVTKRDKLCLFIDGLDEYAGTPEQLAFLFKDLIRRNDNIKLCVASRPWVVFEDAFNTAPHLRLEDLTYPDIHKYVSSRLLHDPEFQKLQAREPEFAGELIDNIVRKASGVFLWVYLVVNSLVAGMSYGDRIADLQKRLDMLPPDLEELYEKLLGSLDPFYLEHAAQLLMMAEKASKPLSLVLLSFADEETIDSVTRMSTRSMSTQKLEYRLEATTRRLNSRLKGLLAVSRPQVESTDVPTAPTAPTAPVEPSESSEPVKAVEPVEPDHPAKPPGPSQPAEPAEPAKPVETSEAVKPIEPVEPTEPAEPTVQYLHRTVKDFLAGEKAQRLLLSSLQTPFDPYLSLCVANWAYIKTCPPDKTPIKLIRDCLGYAAKVSAESEKSVYRVIEDMDKSLPTIYPSTNDTYLGVEWDEVIDENHFGQNFASLVIRHGVTSYVKSRAETQGHCLAQKPSAAESAPIQWPLLIDAIDTKSPDTKLEMVHCLLDTGADPNYPVPSLGGTPWTVYLKTFDSRIPRLEREKEEAPVLETFLRHGADVKQGRDSLLKHPGWFSFRKRAAYHREWLLNEMQCWQDASRSKTHLLGLRNKNGLGRLRIKS